MNLNRSTKQKLRWRCPDGHEFSRTVDGILASRSFCPECSKRFGLREQFIRDLFFHLFGVFFERTRSIKWLKNKRGNFMELDGYNEALSIAFEHNGQQHYELDGYFLKDKDKLETRYEDDAEKIRLCKENKVILIIIPYNVKLADIQEYVLNEFNKVNVIPSTTTYFDPGISAPSILKKLQQYAETQGGQLISTEYKGGGEKLIWKCKDQEHPQFKAAPSSLINRKSWCKKCANQKQSDSYRVSVKAVQEWAREAGGKLVIEQKDNQLFEKGYALKDKATFHCFSCNENGERSIEQVKKGSLCLCYTRKKRITFWAVKEELSRRSLHYVSGEIQGNSSIIKIQCDMCGYPFIAKVSNIRASKNGCPKCRPNASISLGKAHKLAEKLNFSLLSKEVSNGNDILVWKCNMCGNPIEKSYRIMRNVRQCPACREIEAKKKLGID